MDTLRSMQPPVKALEAPANPSDGPDSMTPDTIPTAWALWGGAGDTYGFPPKSWQDAIGNLGEILFWYAIGGKHWRQPVFDAASPLEKANFTAWLELEAELNDLVLHTARAAAVIGFALARTWPGTLEDLADWPTRALAHAGPIERAGEEGAR